MERAPRRATFKEVKKQELKDICERRVKAGLGHDPLSNGGPPDPFAVERGLVGLALSGGGVRSGAVGLGFLQALYDRRVLNQFDYLSTVSGGGYAGSYLSAVLEEFPEGAAIDWQVSGGSSGAAGEPLSFSSEPKGSQPADVRRLVHSGLYLRKLPEFINSALLGVVVNWTMLLAGLIAAASFVAIAYRSVDLPWVSGVLEAVGFAGDLRRAFFFSFAIFCVWILAHLARLATRTAERHARWTKYTSWLAILLIASLACAVVQVVNTGDLDTTTAYSGQASPSRVQRTEDAQYWTWAVLVTALVISLLPFLRRNDLLRSGAAPSAPWQGWVARIAGWGLLAGVPLAIFGLIVQENLFNFNQNRPDRYRLTRLHIRDWIDFSANLERQAVTKAAGPGQRLWAIANATESDVESTPLKQLVALPLPTIARLEQRRRELQRDTWLINRWLTAPLLLVGRGVSFEQWQAREEALTLESQVIDRISADLGNPDFYQFFPDALPELHPFGRDEDEAIAYRRRRDFAASNAKLSKDLNLVAQIKRNQDLLSQPLKKDTSHNELDERMAARQELNRLAELQQHIERGNRDLLETWYGNHIRPATTVLSLVTLSSDQLNRFIILGLSLAVFLVLGLTVNVNQTSAHAYYRERLAEMWVFRRQRTGASIRLGALKNTDCGGPYHLINASVNLLGPNRDVAKEPTECFLFSRRYCGSDRVDYESTVSYDRHQITLADAMAISGGAVSPVAVSNNLLLFYALLLTNARLGMWVPNPGDVTSQAYPTFLPALLGYFGGTPEGSAYLYVSDGGHHENTGIEPLLRRRCRLIVACDASWDPDYQFLDLLRLFRRMGVFEGIQFTAANGGTITLDSLVPLKESQFSEDHSVLIRIVYPDVGDGLPTEGWLIYVKSTLTGKERPELTQYKKDNAVFPHDPTLDQFYDPRRFECYRELGYELGLHVTSRLCSDARNCRSAWSADLDCSIGFVIDRLLERLSAEDDKSRETSLLEIVQRVYDSKDRELAAYVADRLQSLAFGAVEGSHLAEHVRKALKEILFEEFDGSEATTGTNSEAEEQPDFESAPNSSANSDGE